MSARTDQSQNTKNASNSVSFICIEIKLDVVVADDHHQHKKLWPENW